MKARKDTRAIYVHCSATRPNLQVGVRQIREWHLEKGWEDIGYHYVICRDSTLEVGRPERFIGAHVEGANHNSIGICLVGGLDEKGVPAPNYGQGMLETLRRAIDDIQFRYMRLNGDGVPLTVAGHHDYAGVTKACPCFNVPLWYKTGRVEPSF